MIAFLFCQRTVRNAQRSAVAMVSFSDNAISVCEVKIRALTNLKLLWSLKISLKHSWLHVKHALRSQNFGLEVQVFIDGSTAPIPPFHKFK